MGKDRHHDRMGFFFILVAALLVVAAAAIASSLFFQAPLAYSGAYFWETPKKAFAGKAFPVEFFVENREGKGAQYNLRMMADGRLWSDKNVFLAAGEKKRFAEPVLIEAKGFKKIELLVSKEGSSNPFGLFFWVEVK